MENVPLFFISKYHYKESSIKIMMEEIHQKIDGFDVNNKALGHLPAQRAH
jgi:hypothetical protein